MISLKEHHPLTISLAAAALAGLLAIVATLLPSFVFVAGAKDLPAIQLPVLRHVDTQGWNRYADVVSHSLFNATRRKEDSADKSAAASLPPLENYRLVGIVTAPDLAVALIERKATKEVLRLRAGDTLDGRTVGQIDVSGVALSGSGHDEKLIIPKVQNWDSAQPAPAAQQLVGTP